MNFLKNIFGEKKETVQTNHEFWAWFQTNEQNFFDIVKSGENIEENFFNKLSPKLDRLKNGYYFLTGMADDNTAELILTSDGVIKNIPFVEELVNSAPTISNWKFTALKPSNDLKNVRIDMSGCKFESENLSFYAIDHKNYPDEIDIVIVHHDYKEKDKSIITNGTFIFLDNYLGELNSVTIIDNARVIPKDLAEQELIPISKLKDYLIWREKEFIEKYEGVHYNTESDSYSSMTAELDNGRKLIAIINTTLLEWDRKASHPWILNIEIKYNGENNNGMPNNTTYELLNKFEEEIMLELKDFEGYLNIGRQTADGERIIYFACKDFRKPSKVLVDLIIKYSGKLDVSYDIFKDKYWQTLEKFRPN